MSVWIKLEVEKTRLEESAIFIGSDGGGIVNGSNVEPGYNDIGLYDTLYIASDILWYRLVPRCLQ